MHATKLLDAISADFSAGRRRWPVVRFLLDLDAPIVLADDAAAGGGLNGRIGRSIGRNLNHGGVLHCKPVATITLDRSFSAGGCEEMRVVSYPSPSKYHISPANRCKSSCIDRRSGSNSKTPPQNSCISGAEGSGLPALALLSSSRTTTCFHSFSAAGPGLR